MHWNLKRTAPERPDLWASFPETPQRDCYLALSTALLPDTQTATGAYFWIG